MFNAMNEKQLLRLCFSAALCMGALSVSAASTEATGSSYSVQQANVKQVSGQVLDENGEPIIGATIKEKGTQNAVISDVDGNFVLNTTEGAELEITYIGYADQTLKVTGKDKYSVSMSSGTKELNEVVVTALGIKRAEKALSYNVQQVSGEDLLTNKDANFINSLNGKVAGVNVVSSSGAPGSGSTIRIRSGASLSASNDPLIVIDGVPVDNSSIEGGSNLIGGINPNDIETFTVLKLSLIHI